MMITSALPLFDQGMVEDGYGHSASWMVIETNTPNEKGQRMHLYQCITLKDDLPIKKSGYCTKLMNARRAAIRQCKKLLADTHRCNTQNPQL